jgi:hypothetical protein
MTKLWRSQHATIKNLDPETIGLDHDDDDDDGSNHIVATFSDALYVRNTTNTNITTQLPTGPITGTNSQDLS